jgi:hypothetical protein
VSRTCLALSLPALLLALAAARPAEGPPDRATADRIARLLAELDDDDFAVREEASAELLRIGPPAEAALRKALAESPSAEVRRRARDLLRAVVTHFEGESAGWSWIYGSIAHGQTFRSAGKDVRSLRLRVARLNAAAPAAPLEVEVRDPTLKNTYARGLVPVEDAGRDFAWREVRWRHRAPLAPGGRYVLFFHSRDTFGRAPWLVNEMYADLYPDGEHLGYGFDFFFRLEFGNGRSLHVGPAKETDQATPFGSCGKGGLAQKGSLTLVGFGPVPSGKDVAPRGQ